MFCKAFFEEKVIFENFSSLGVYKFCGKPNPPIKKSCKKSTKKSKKRNFIKIIKIKDTNGTLKNKRKASRSS